MNGAGLALAAALAAAQPAPLETPVDTVVPATAPVLAAGTRVAMRTLEDLSSKRAHQGQRVKMETVEEVRIDGHLVIPKGSPGIGEVARVLERGAFAKRGKLRLKVMFVEVGGARIRLDGEARDRGASGTAPLLLTAPLIGVSAAWFSGKHARLPAGTVIDGHVYEDVPLRFADR